MMMMMMMTMVTMMMMRMMRMMVVLRRIAILINILFSSRDIPTGQQ